MPWRIFRSRITRLLLREEQNRQMICMAFIYRRSFELFIRHRHVVVEETDYGSGSGYDLYSTGSSGPSLLGTEAKLAFWWFCETRSPRVQLIVEFMGCRRPAVIFFGISWIGDTHNAAVVHNTQMARNLGRKAKAKRREVRKRMVTVLFRFILT
jgi:hypothetical protein